MRLDILEAVGDAPAEAEEGGTAAGTPPALQRPLGHPPADREIARRQVALRAGQLKLCFRALAWITHWPVPSRPDVRAGWIIARYQCLGIFAIVTNGPCLMTVAQNEYGTFRRSSPAS